jgi:hypothetical protein
VPALPVYGPDVWTVTVTVVAMLPAGSVGGENEHVEPAGSPEQVKVIGAVKVLEPTGEINMVVAVDCPGRTPGGGFRLAGTLTSVFTARLTA